MISAATLNFLGKITKTDDLVSNLAAEIREVIANSVLVTTKSLYSKSD